MQQTNLKNIGVRYLRLLSLLMITGGLVAPSVAFAQTRCFPVPQIMKLLKERYSETVMLRGDFGNGNQLIITSSVDGSSFTVFNLTPTGMMCLIGAGKDLELAEPVPDEGPPA